MAGRVKTLIPGQLPWPHIISVGPCVSQCPCLWLASHVRAEAGPVRIRFPTLLSLLSKTRAWRSLRPA